MLKQNVIIEIVKGDATFRFEMPVGSTFGSCIDACFDVMQMLHKQQAEAIEAVKPKGTDNEPADKSE